MSYPIILTTISKEDVEAVDSEVLRARMHGEKFSSLHEAYAVIAEEMDEIWDIVRQKKKDRNPNEIRKEIVQLAAMSFKALESMKNFTGGLV